MAAETTRTFTLDGESVTGELLWEAEFGDSDEWLVESQAPENSEVRFEHGSLTIDCVDAGGVTVWPRRGFPADVVFEYTATVDEDGADRPTSRNLNCFFRASEEPDKPLDATTRSGAYPDYHDWDNYIFTLTRTHTRLRRDPGFELQSELMMGVQPGEEYTVQIATMGDRIRAAVNGRVLHDWTDLDPHGAGWIGMRTYDTVVTYSGWTVYDIN